MSIIYWRGNNIKNIWSNDYIVSCWQNMWPFKSCYEICYHMWHKQNQKQYLFLHFCSSLRDGVQALLIELNIAPEEYAFGRTKIFIRNPQTVSIDLAWIHLLSQPKCLVRDTGVLTREVWQNSSLKRLWRTDYSPSSILLGKYVNIYWNTLT